MPDEKTRPSWTPSEDRLVAQYAQSRAEKEVDDYATAKSDAERGIEKIKLDERNKFIDELLADAENEAWIARMGDDEDRLRVAEYLAEYLNQVDVETGERTL